MIEIEGECWTPVLRASAPDCFREAPGGIRLGGPGIVQDAAGCWQARVRNPSRRRYGAEKWLWVDQTDPRAVTRYRGRAYRSVTGAALPARSRLAATCGNRACINPDHLDLIELPALEYSPSEGGHWGWAGDGEDEVYCWISDPLPLPKPPKPLKVAKPPRVPKPPKAPKPPRVPKGRALGSQHGSSKVTEEDVRTIRAAAASSETSLKAIAARYGLSRSSLGKILRRKTWAHVA